MTLAAEFSKPSIEYSDISPLLIWLMSILVGILLRRSFFGF